MKVIAGMVEMVAAWWVEWLGLDVLPARGMENPFEVE